MSFQKLERKVGFGLAVAIFNQKDDLSSDFFDNLSFDQWLEVYNRAPSGSELKQTALAKMSEKAETFDQWLKVYYKVPSGSELKQTALAKMLGEEKTFDQWLEVYGRAPSGSELEQTALARMSELV